MTHDAELNPTDLRQQAKANRRAFAQSIDSRFVREMKRVMTDYLAARAQGVSREDGIKGIEAALRELWPKRPTKYPTCDGCDNTGWHIRYCTHALRCGRERCSECEEAYEHSFATPCDCPLGDRFRKRLLEVTEELTRIGKTKNRKKTGFSRVGV